MDCPATPHHPQLGFDELLVESDSVNKKQARDRQTRHLPGDMEAALPFFRELTRLHHDAMVRADVDESKAPLGRGRVAPHALTAGRMRRRHELRAEFAALGLER
jgi:hypothetical protein